MIFIKFLTFVYNLIKGSNFEVLFDENFLNTLKNINAMIGLVLPMGTVKAILAITLTLTTFRIVLSVWKAILQYIPFV